MSGIQHKKPFGVYHWDTFDNNTILIAERCTHDAAIKFIKSTYKKRINLNGADRVDIVDKAGNVVQSYKVC
jgi:hypothetical protein